MSQSDVLQPPRNLDPRLRGVQQQVQTARRVEQVARQTPEAQRYVGTTDQPAFTNSWTNFDTLRKVRFYRYDGRVYLAGLMKSGTLTAAAFTLPTGYWPDSASGGTIEFLVSSSGVAGLLVVSTAGVVTPFSGSNTYFSLEGVNFRHAV